MIIKNKQTIDIKNTADRGGCYPPRPKSSVDNTFLDRLNSSYPTKVKFNYCFIIPSQTH